MSEFEFRLDGPISLSCRLGGGSLAVHAEPGREVAQVSGRTAGSARRRAVPQHHRTARQPTDRARPRRGFRLRPHRPARRGRPDAAGAGRHRDAAGRRLGRCHACTAGRRDRRRVPARPPSPWTRSRASCRHVPAAATCGPGSVTGAVTCKGGSGDVELGEVGGDLAVTPRQRRSAARHQPAARSGCGPVRAPRRSGRCRGDAELTSGSGSGDHRAGRRRAGAAGRADRQRPGPHRDAFGGVGRQRPGDPDPGLGPAAATSPCTARWPPRHRRRSAEASLLAQVAGQRARDRSPRPVSTTRSSPSQVARSSSCPASCSATRPASISGFGPGRLHPQRPALPVGLQVHPGHQLLAEQERQHVVAVHPLRGRGVDLDPVVEAEQAATPGRGTRSAGRTG